MKRGRRKAQRRGWEVVAGVGIRQISFTGEDREKMGEKENEDNEEDDEADGFQVLTPRSSDVYPRGTRSGRHPVAWAQTLETSCLCHEPRKRRGKVKGQASKVR
jgi:hypothetical protein